MQLVRKSAQNNASDPLPFLILETFEITLASDDITRIASVKLVTLPFMFTIGPIAAADIRHNLPELPSGYGKQGVFLRDTNYLLPIPPYKVMPVVIMTPSLHPGS